MSLDRVISRVESRSPTFYITFKHEGEEFTVLATSIEEFKEIIKDISKNPETELLSHEVKREFTDIYLWY